MSFLRRTAALGLALSAIAALAAPSSAVAQGDAQSAEVAALMTKYGGGKKGHWCEGAGCQSFCATYCTKFNPSAAWSGGSGVGTNDNPAPCNFPEALVLSADAAPGDLRPIPDMKNIKIDGQERATTLVIDALRRADAWIDAHPGSLPPGHVVSVNNCFRSAKENAEKECHYIQKGMHIVNKWTKAPPTTPAEEALKKKQMAEVPDYLDPNTKGLAWPGPGHHTRGRACDVVVAKVQGRRTVPQFACSVDDRRISTPRAEQEKLSKMLNEILTNPTVGAARLSFEMWHYDFGLSDSEKKSCHCVGAECDQHWPPRCTNSHGSGCDAH